MASMRPRAHYGREAELPGSDREAREISMLAPRLLQSALVLVSTRLADRVLGELQWAQQLTDTGLRGLTQLFWSNVALHGTFERDLDKRLDYQRGADRPAPPDPSAAQVLPFCPVRRYPLTSPVKYEPIASDRAGCRLGPAGREVRGFCACRMPLASAALARAGPVTSRPWAANRATISPTAGSRVPGPGTSRWAWTW